MVNDLYNNIIHQTKEKIYKTCHSICKIGWLFGIIVLVCDRHN